MEGIKRLWRSIPRAGKASFALFLANTVTAGIAYITTPLYTRLLTADEYGQVSVFLSWKQIFGIVAMFSLAGGVFNNGMVDYPKKRDEFSLSMLGLSNAITLIVCSALLVCYQFVKHWIGLDAILILLMTGTFILRPAYEFWCSRQRYELKYKAMTVWIIACAFFSPAIAVICIYLFNNDRVYARIFGGEIPLIIIYAGFYIHLIIKGSGRIDTKYWKSAFLFNLPLLPHYLSANILNSSDRVMISQLISDAATAHYTVAYSVAAVITIVWSAANGSLLPYTYEKCKEKKYQDISRVTQRIFSSTLQHIW